MFYTILKDMIFKLKTYPVKYAVKSGNAILLSFLWDILVSV